MIPILSGKYALPNDVLCKPRTLKVTGDGETNNRWKKYPGGKRDHYSYRRQKLTGLHIPTLCHHEGLSPLANCRLCVVEVTQNNRTRVVTSCNYQVQEGMQVATQTGRIVSMRKTIIKLIMGRSPNVKIVRDLAAAMGIDKTPFTLENEKCILCGLCEHVCSEYIGAHAITFTGHGTGKFVSAPLLRIVQGLHRLRSLC